MRRALAAAAAAAVLPAAASSFQAAVDNDAAFDTDRGYTSGVRLTWVGDAPSGEPRREFGLQQDIFTPDAKRDILGRRDRPYAGRLRFLGALHRIGDDRHDTLAVSAGVLGPSALGRQAQDAIHRIVPSPATDWSLQLSDRFDGSVGGTLSRVAWRPGDAFAVAWHAGATAGTVEGFGHAGAELRWGPAGAPWSALLRHVATPVADAGRGGGLSVFLGASVKGVFRDRLLERNAGDPGALLDRKRAVGRIAAGVAWRAAWGAVSFALAQDSDAFEGQRYPQRFGSLTLAIALD